MNRDVFLAILAMDAYNRGYSTHISGLLSSGHIGNATFLAQSDIRAGSTEVAAGFYASAYDVSGVAGFAVGERVISYRGTNQAPTVGFLSDILNGWSLGAGYPSSTQAGMAQAFYQSVAGVTVATHGQSAAMAPHVTLTGHSLGGGLAGYVAALPPANASAVGFDHMPFAVAAWNEIVAIAAQEAALEVGINIEDLIHFPIFPTSIQPYFDFNKQQQFIDVWSRNIRDYSPAISSLEGYYFQGEVLQILRSSAPQTAVRALFDLLNLSSVADLTTFFSSGTVPSEGDIVKYAFDIPGIQLGAVERHSISLLAITMFADLDWSADGQHAGMEWRQAGKYFVPALFDRRIATSLGIETTRESVGEPESQLSEKIAYSIINEGDASGRPFGDTAVRALLDDAEDLGKAETSAMAGAPVAYDLTTRNLLGSLLVNYAGALAHYKILADESQDAAAVQAGVLTYSAGDLILDISVEKWKAGDNVIQAVERENLVNHVLSTAGVLNIISGALAEITGIDATIGQLASPLLHQIGSLAFDLGGSGGSIGNAPTGNFSLYFLRSDGATTEYRGNTDTIIVSSSASDHFIGGAGTDVFLASGGSDIFDGGEGNDWVDYSSTFSVFPGPLVVSVGNNGSGLEFRVGGDVSINVENFVGSFRGDIIQLTGPLMAGDRATIYESIAGRPSSAAPMIMNCYSVSEGIELHLSQDKATGYIRDRVNGGQIELVGFGTEILATDADDIITDLSGDQKTVQAGRGNDDIEVGDGDALIFAGEGADQILSGAGNDVIIDQNSTSMQTGPTIGHGFIQSGAGDDRIVVSYTNSPQFGDSSANEIGYGLRPGAGNDSITLDFFDGAVGYNYDRGDGNDVITIKSVRNIVYSPTIGVDGGISQPHFIFNFSQYSASEISVSWSRESVTLVSEDLPNRDLPSLMLQRGTLTFSFSDGGSISIRDVYGVLWSVSPQDQSPVASFEGLPNNWSYTTSDNGVLTTITTAGSGTRQGSISDDSKQVDLDTSPMAAPPSGDQTILLRPGNHNYVGGAGVDQLIVTWDLNALSVGMVGNMLTVTDRWGQLGTTRLTGFDTIYVVKDQQSYTPQAFFAAYGDASITNLVGTSANDTLNGSNGKNHILGLGGNDTITLGTANDYVDGGDSNDLILLQGGGADVAIGGTGNDGFYFGGAFDDGDFVDGGAGSLDQLALKSNYAGVNAITFGANQLLNVEMIVCLPRSDTHFGGAGSGTPYSYTLTMNDGNVAAGATLIIQANALATDEVLTFNGSAELDGRYTVYSGNGADSIISGALGDTISGRGGADMLTGGGGNDIFLYTNITDSITTARDRILDFTTGDTIDLSRLDAITGGANDAFSFIGDAAFSNVAGQLRAFLSQPANNLWTVEADVNGDGIADLSMSVFSIDAHPLTASDFML